MRYKLLDNERGVIVSRTSEVCSDKLNVEFEDVPAGATAIFEHPEGRVKQFAEISSGTCFLPLDRFKDGRITLAVAILDGSADPQRWLCEEFLLKRLGDGSVLVSPNDGDLPLEVSLIKVELCEIRRELFNLAKKQSELSMKLESIMEGYDLT